MPLRGIYVIRSLMAGMAMILAFVAAPTSTRAQWPFSPAGYLYPQRTGGAAPPIDHVTLLADDAERYHLQRPGLYTTDGRVYRFVSLVREWMQERHKLVFEFETETVDDTSYRFAGEFHNSHVYEEYVTDPNEVVASGELYRYEGPKLQQRTPVKFTYVARPRDAKFVENVPYPSGKTDLMLAVIRRDLAEVRGLLAQGVAVNAITRSGQTALIYAVGGERQRVELARVLLAAGADINLAGRWSTPLIAATGNGDTSLIELLLAAGANVNAADANGLTALICEVQEIGVRNGSRESVKALLRAGADVNAKDKSGRTALSIARAAHDDETVAILLAAGAKD